MKTFLIIVGIIYLVWKAIQIIIYKGKVMMEPHQYAKMKWKTIKKLYPINPEKWDYNYGRYERYAGEEFPLRILYYENTPIMLTAIDFIRFRIAYKIHAHTYGCDKASHRALKNIMEDVQEDIDKQKEQAQKEIDTALQEMRGAINNETMDR
ncbi:MAG: hypothetical protein K2N48_01660 [Muribaculaceae bacterium]|nr:hypothetical protein [Muribaculaceae bacterium]